MIHAPSPPLDLIENAVFAGAKPRLSVLIPFFRDDPRALLPRLEAEYAAVDGGAEIIVMDDGGGDAALADAVAACVADLRLPARFLRLHANAGRAVGRNVLAAHARGGHFLFLDSDMRPDHRRFLTDWLRLADEQAPAVAFGGFSLVQASHDRAFAVHRSMARKSDCLPADIRALQPEKYVFTSNLLIRRDVFGAERFDASFSGWGWEDVEWGVRVSRRYPILHVDICASHIGLDPVCTLIRKYEQSTQNFAKIVASHREILSSFPSYKAAKLLKWAPGRGLLRQVLKRLALTEQAPTATRAFALRLYRAALYAQAV